jgi:ABC-type dipeptide/oligopeptide/nickel transport system, ATPase component
MGLPVLIMGESGSGKSTSLRNFEKGQVGIFNVAGKPLPFKKQLPKYDNATYNDIISSLNKHKLNTYVIDDSQYLMAFAMFDRAHETGYAKFTDCAVDYRNLIDFVIRKTPADTIVYFLQHTELDMNGKIKVKTSGKMLDSQLTVEGLFSIVLLAEADNEHYFFTTQSEGRSTAKSPMGMFAPQIDNDLQFVDKAIREYWSLAPKTKGEKK